MWTDLPGRRSAAPSSVRRGWPPAWQRADPVADLAAAAGYDDPERWWEDVVEHVPGPAVFGALAEAIGILRADEAAADPHDEVREAHMRKVLRREVKDGYRRIAVVCGAWHVPALQSLPPAADDDRLLRGLPKARAVLTWVPWTYGRLAFASGYGAGVRSPGWYDHLFSSDGRPIERWLARAAAALRGRPLAGLEEVTEAARAVLCEGSDLLTGLIQRRLVVGERLGAVPAATPMVPLQRDLRQAQRSLRLRPEAEPRDYDLDLRTPSDLARSHLLHRLTLLRRALGHAAAGPGPRHRDVAGELAAVLAARARRGPDRGEHVGQHGPGRRRATARSAASSAATLQALTGLAERCLLADLGDALPDVLAAVRDRAALEGDVTHLMGALPALVRAARYGDVRGTDPGRLGQVAVEMITRICAGLPAAVASLDQTAERAMRDRIRRCPAAAAAGWAEGFLAGSGLLLVHDDRLLGLADGWLAGLGPDAFAAALPALRRTFGAFAPGERRAIGEKAARLDGRGQPPGPAAPPPEAAGELDEDRAAMAVRAVAAILGLDAPAGRAGVP